ncbi:MAG: bifunctional 5,10-methylenetetrahydrofolate dehydrogenase/5,10-methenyltetrahydrofolate cyclohydrolase [Candidatus Pacebacteria bacterium]|nr:bifunctional 5,10-methylenetetrahydrofolate dehydrogenase/5,10-methenyltetrahydrofolate cyclohydrolase [Candidatus Paceibacterota bacterium]
MIVDGKAIAASILESVAEDVSKLDHVPCMAAVTCSPNFETKKYLDMKKKKAAAVGISLSVVELPADATTEDVLACVARVVKDSDGIVVQLPLPDQIDKEAVIAAIPTDKDPDGFHYGNVDSACLPPVVGAIDAITKRHQVEWLGKKVAVLGEGRLVGLPAKHYAEKAGAEVTVITKSSPNKEAIKSADIIISGIGQPHFIKADSIKEGAVIFDAGTSEDGGVLVGDADSSVVEKVSLITPVPGGIGPITIACLLRNLIGLVRQ